MIPHRAFFGNAEHDFRLELPQILELERSRDAGIGELSRRVMGSSYRLADLTETLRLALVGGGLDPQEAAALVTAYLPMQPLEKTLTIAVDVLTELYFGAQLPADDVAGEFA
ncbi:gene transfer agent family protein [Aureimonas leprariae]|uniref:Gene transfer agent family protein n=1 Tax=Plantimonas leprariae TaxID=2615207 RepID=A0A7V7TW80_9HYPH|nr:gene transfer agent family protein [Aureimonas leprariae]KAB0679515.1 gene transfer agent family protein [Aureimonas leprariae]